jgi:sarcosine dehydrogenase
VGYAPVFALRVTYVGELGYELYIPTEYACHVYETLWDAGQDFSVKNAGYRAIDSLHFEKGYCYWGSELSPEYNPYEAGLGFCVKLNKGQFVGKRALSKIKADGSKSSLFTFTLLTDETVRMRGSEPILHHGEVLGVTTSAGYGHTVRKNICYGYLKKDQAGYGDEYEIEVYKKTYRARLEKNRALYDPKREKILM